MSDLRTLVAAGDPASVQDALAVAAGMSVRAVQEELEETFLDAHAEAASTFFQAWLPRLAAFERMQAAEWVTSQYLLSMVHIDHAYGIGAQLQLQALAAAAGALADALSSFGAFTDGPDAEVGNNVTATLSDLADTVRGVSNKLADVVDGLPDIP